ncbi:MAG TPA: adenylate/guanylate cyclase domain-containing protein [Methylomirabilota bacterium]|nr:adenylate/guanylate cyclase domain-containing protein [Methylomirabilota bacterium]
MKCPRCQQENPPRAKFCLECATPLALRCANCGTQLPAGAKFCFECATPVGAPGSLPRFSRPEAYTPKHLAERIINSKTALEGERKQVTVLFADLKGSMELLADRDPEEARKLLDPILERMIEAVHRYEGTVNQVMGDGIMALFGAPLAHEDHAVRACYAALHMQEMVKRDAEEVRRREGVLPQIRVGLNSGEVVVRSIGSDLHMDYTAVGQTTHLAARMEQMAAAGSILMSGDTLRLAEGFVEVKPLGPVNVKGLSEPVEVVEVTGGGPVRSRLQAAARRGLTRFVGRDVELDQLRRAQQHAGEGHGQVAAVVGEAGMGKSRLVYEFTHSHRLQGWLVLEAACVSYGKATSYLPVIELLKSYFRIQDRDDLREIREKVTGKLLTLDEALRPTLPALLSMLDIPMDDPTWQALDPGRRRQRTREAVKQLLVREAREQPVLMIVEDLHWIDGETQALLDSLIDSVGSARLLLLVNFRPEFQHAWAGKTYYQQVRIDPLPAESADELLDALLGLDAGLGALKRLLIERTEGNPLFLEESVSTLVESGALVGERGAHRLVQDLRTIRVPTTVQAILAARIDRLAPEDKRLLQTASVVGKDVSFTVLRAIAELPDAALREGLARLQVAEFLYETRLFPELEYTFKHALTHEVAYGSILQERRRALHAHVVDTMEARHESRLGEHVDALAHHAVRAERWDRAARYLYQAGEKAFANARYHAAATFYEAAVEALDRLGGAADLALKVDACLELWAARSSVGQYDRFAELADKAETLARALDDGPRLAQVQLRRAQAIAATCVMPGTLQSAIEEAREAFERASPNDLRTRSYARFIIGHASRDLGRIPEAVREFTAGIALFEGVDRYGQDTGFAVPICVSLGAWCSEAYAAAGEFQKALVAARDALRTATDIHHASSLATANMFLGSVHSARGEMDTAVPFLERGFAIASENDLYLGTVRAAALLAYALVMLGERDRGLEYLARARARSAEAHVAHHGPATGYGTVTASTYLVANRAREAAIELRQGLAVVAARNARGYRASLLRLEGDLLAQQNAAGACERLQEALTLAVELALRPEAAHCHLDLGMLYRRTDKSEEAREHLTAATSMYRDMGMTYWGKRAEAEQLT